jgi:tRNA (mo5U34)-methyltransferase
VARKLAVGYLASNPDLCQRKLRAVARVPFWWHTIDLGDGVTTPGHSSARSQEVRANAIPGSLQGKTVLDAGCWDGFFSFWCERRGAAVTPIDDFQHKDFVGSKYGIELKGGEGFRVAARLLGSRLKLKRRDFASLQGSFDIVLFFGVLYHERHPLLALEHLARLTRECAVVETHYIKSDRQPFLRFYAGSSLNDDPTNFWGPTLSCVELMLREVGFRRVSLVKTYRDNDDRAIFLARR